MNSDLLKRQLDVCARNGAQPAFLAGEDRLAIGRNFDPKQFPVNGLRHPINQNMCGWYIWSGEELSQDADYFNVLCYAHLIAKRWEWLDYLALPTGWRFLTAPGHKDIWFDEALF